MNQKVVIAGLGVIIIAGGAWFFRASSPSYANINSYEDCVAAGYPILESYPEQCKLPDGRTFVHEVPPVSIPTSTIPIATTTAAFGKPVVLEIGDTVLFPNALSIELREINDSRCPKDVQCIWQGQLSTLFSVTAKGVSEELRLGTEMKQSATLMGYSFTLQSATTERVTIVITVASVSLNGVNGFIHTGPSCPVERNPPDPNCADKPYANASVTVKNKATGATVSQSVSDANGNFHIALTPGTYRIDVSSPAGGFLPSCETKEAVVKAGAYTSVDVSCDSGIR